MNVRSMLDCWASVRLKRMACDYDSPTLDAVLCPEEARAERIDAFEARMHGWVAADDAGDLTYPEAKDLALALALKKAFEQGSPKTGRGRAVQNRVSCPSVARRGPSEVLALSEYADALMRAYTGQNGVSLPVLQSAVLKTHPRRGRYSGLGQKETWRRHRFDGRFRSEVSKFVKWAEGTLGALDFPLDEEAKGLARTDF